MTEPGPLTPEQISSSGSGPVTPDLTGQQRVVPATLDAGFVHGEHLPDSYLIDRAQAGSTEAFEVLVGKHRTRVYRVALRLVSDHHAAEDVAQEALVSAWRGLPGFRRDAEFTTWLHQIVINQARTHLARRRPISELSGDEPIAETDQPEPVVQSNLRATALRAAVDELPFDLRAPLVMVQFEDFSYEQAADVLGVSVSTVRGRIFRARRALLDTMREWR